MKLKFLLKKKKRFYHVFKYFKSKIRITSWAQKRKTLKIPKVLSPQKQVNTQTMDKLGRDKTATQTNMEGE